jgi:hypothetical protein
VPTVVPSSSVSLCTDLPPELAAVVAAWPFLPPAIKAGISAIVESTRAVETAGNQSAPEAARSGG